jgi:hypothetical protein
MGCSGQAALTCIGKVLATAIRVLISDTRATFFILSPRVETG